MFEKIKKLPKHPIVRDMKDLRVLGLVFFGAAVLLVSWSSVRVIETNYKLQQKIARMEEETKLLELENANTKLENEYYRTDQYLELQARKQFGKAAPGETVLTVPESIALANTVDFAAKQKQGRGREREKPFYQKNFEAWMDFFFHRNPSTGV